MVISLGEFAGLVAGTIIKARSALVMAYASSG